MYMPGTLRQEELQVQDQVGLRIEVKISLSSFMRSCLKPRSHKEEADPCCCCCFCCKFIRPLYQFSSPASSSSLSQAHGPTQAKFRLCRRVGKLNVDPQKTVLSTQEIKRSDDVTDVLRTK
ncbi:hypothetical protein U0070_007941 [Myodes glareolus]|uniref:Uncharacterized protein n=1 Tax=Myodes glareolus TaxID=447135 RepID=A0AAW0IGA8_MYOGA